MGMIKQENNNANHFLLINYQSQNFKISSMLDLIIIEECKFQTMKQL